MNDTEQLVCPNMFIQVKDDIVNVIKITSDGVQRAELPKDSISPFMMDIIHGMSDTQLLACIETYNFQLDSESSLLDYELLDVVTIRDSDGNEVHVDTLDDDFFMSCIEK